MLQDLQTPAESCTLNTTRTITSLALGKCLGMHLAYVGIRSIHMLHERMNNLMNPLSEHHLQQEIQLKEIWLRLHMHCIHGRSHLLFFVYIYPCLLHIILLHLSLRIISMIMPCNHEYFFLRSITPFTCPSHLLIACKNIFSHYNNR